MVLIGATTENPYFSVNAPLLSRARLLRLQALTDEQLVTLIRRALADHERGLGRRRGGTGGRGAGASCCGGQRRRPGSAQQPGVPQWKWPQPTPASRAPRSTGPSSVTADAVGRRVQSRAIVYDGDGDAHYDTMSALHQEHARVGSGRGRVLAGAHAGGGRRSRAIARRIIVHAAEDVGNAESEGAAPGRRPRPGGGARGAARGAAYPLAQAAIYIATAPKSNAAYLAIDRALEAVRTERWEPVPIHLRDTSYRGRERLGHGAGYKYPHDFPGHHVPQSVLAGQRGGPAVLRAERPGRGGGIGERLRRLKERDAAGGAGHPAAGPKVVSPPRRC